MTIEALKFIKKCMEELKVPYEFMEWASDVPVLFFVGEYSEEVPMYEDGHEQGTFILTGTATGNFLELETWKQKIKEYFTKEGITEILEDGSGIAVSYDSSFPIPCEEQGVFRIQINLNVQEWSVK